MLMMSPKKKKSTKKHAIKTWKAWDDLDFYAKTTKVLSRISQGTLEVTTLGIACGHYDYDTIVGNMFSLDTASGRCSTGH